jgi:hypothetical protein
MNLGTGWLIIEESPHTDTRTLISIVNPRKRESYVQDYMEQLYVDKFASIEEKIAYKKNPKSWPYPAQPVKPLFPSVLSCGHDPIFMAYRCHKLKRKNGEIEYTFNTLKGQTKDLLPIIQENTRTIKIT